MLQNQVDALFAELEEHPLVETAGPVDSPTSPHFVMDDGLGFKIAVVGDSTMRVRTLISRPMGSRFRPL